MNNKAIWLEFLKTYYEPTDPKYCYKVFKNEEFMGIAYISNSPDDITDDDLEGLAKFVEEIEFGQETNKYKIAEWGLSQDKIIEWFEKNSDENEQ